MLMNELKELIQKNKFVVVDFYANWCGPCKVLSSTIDGIKEKYQDVVFVKSDVETDEASTEYGVRNLPTLIFFKDGEVVNRLTGAIPATELETAVNDLIK